MLKNVFLTAMLVSSVGYTCPNGLVSLGTVNQKERCELKGDYLSSTLRLTDKYEYVINGGVFIGADNAQSSKLIIEPGVVIRGMPAAFISVMRGSTIEAQGTASQPILFTSVKTTERKRGEWGGLVLNGNAPINACKAGATVCEAISEGIKEKEVKFGGTNPLDNSGVLKYVVVEFGGYPISQDNELNGITFNAVGSSTVVENIQVHMNADDGIEFFGGTVNVKNVVLTQNEDDSLDWDFGWTGKVQFIVMDQGKDSVADNGIEADNLKSPMNASPRSNPTISNMTILGSAKSGYGILFKKGTGAYITNTIISGFTKACIDIDDAETFANGAAVHNGRVLATGLKVESSILNCQKPFEAEAGDLFATDAWFNAIESNRLVSPELNGWMPSAQSPALGQAMFMDDFFFEPVDFIGAFGSENWAAGWTVDQLN